MKTFKILGFVIFILTLISFVNAVEVDCGLRGMQSDVLVGFACEEGTSASDLNIKTDSGIYSVVLVDINHDNASTFRINTVDGIKALKKYGKICGDGVQQEGEECDDGNAANNDSCLNNCSINVCGDGSVNLEDSLEECDNGSLNGNACTPAYGQTCYYCDNSCNVVSVTGPYCGDGVVNGEEEQCDGTDLNGATCESEGFDGGTLSCDNCLFNALGCYNDCVLESIDIYDNNDVSQGDVITIGGVMSGDCSDATTVQIDANSSDGSCVIEYSGGDMSGITDVSLNLDSDSSSFSASWTVPEISSDCSGKGANPYVAKLWSGVPGVSNAVSDATNAVSGILNFETVCGNGIVEDGEDCDAGDLNGEECVPEYGENCTYCDNSCNVLSVTGPSCGDGVVNGEEEQCDGTNLSGATCSDLGYDGGDLGCSDYCSYNFSDCYSDVPVCGNGIVEDGEVCDNPSRFVSSNYSSDGVIQKGNYCYDDCSDFVSIYEECEEGLLDYCHSTCDGCLVTYDVSGVECNLDTNLCDISSLVVDDDADWQLPYGGTVCGDHDSRYYDEDLGVNVQCCSHDFECSGGECNSDGVCVGDYDPGWGGPDSCVNNFDCPYGFICVGGSCIEDNDYNGPGTCFTGDTLIASPDKEGLTIESVVAGDVVYSYDFETGDVVESVVGKKFVHYDGKDQLLFVSLSDGGVVKVTDNHPVYSVLDNKFEEMGDFNVGDLVLSFNDISKTYGVVSIIDIEELDLDVPVYSLHLLGDYNYHTANGLLVHNAADESGNKGSTYD